MEDNAPSTTADKNVIRVKSKDAAIVARHWLDAFAPKPTPASRNEEYPGETDDLNG